MSTPTSPSGPGRPVGATPIGARDDGGRRKKGLLWGALALLALIAIALLLSQCAGDDPSAGADAAGSSDPAGSSSSAPSSSSDAGASPSESSAAESSAAPGGTGGSGGGDLVVGEQDVLQAVSAGGAGAATALAELAGQDATATGVQVLAVPADEGFWVGSSDTERVWVQLVGATGESPYQVQEGDTVDLQGVLVAHDETFAAEVGVDEASGAAQLTEQGHHVEVEKSAVQLSE